MHLVELRPNEAVIVVVEPAGDDDLGARRQKDLLLGAPLRHEKVAAVDQR